MIAYFLAQVFGECKIGIYTVKCWLYALGLYSLVKHFRVGILRGELEASAYEPGQPSWLSFRHLASPLFLLVKFRSFHMRCRAGPITEIASTPARVTGTKRFRQNSSTFASKRPRWRNFCLHVFSL